MGKGGPYKCTSLGGMRVAVADVGTNSSHLLIAEALAGGEYRVLDALKDRTRLGECLGPGGELTPEGEDRLASALTRFRELAASAGAGEVRVYATSALREAPNGPEVAARVRERTGVYPAIISGEREGELTYRGAARAVELGPDNVLLDLGGGSLELVRGDAHTAGDVLSLPLGAIRMSLAFPEKGKQAGREVVREVTATVQRALAPHAERFQNRGQTQFVLSSGTAEALAAALSPRAGSVNGSRLSVAALGDLISRLARLPRAERGALPGLERRGETILAGLSTLHAALTLLEAETFTVSEGALREGMLAEQLERASTYQAGLSTRQRSVLALAERFGVSSAHAEQVAGLSRALLTGLQAAGERLPQEARSVLTAAAALHEAGQIVSQSSHHKHSAYLIQHAGLRGFSPREVDLIAQVARYHRKSAPKASHPAYAALPEADRALLRRLAAILRVADGLDRAHAGNTELRALRRVKDGWELEVSGATPLDLAGVGEKADLWEKEYGPLRVRQV